MIPFLVALQFLTIIPVSLPGVSALQQGESVIFYPLVGLLIGSGLFSLNIVLGNNNPPLMQSTLLLIAWVMITGGLHLDGLADCADAWVGGFASQQRSLEIMKDPAAGPIAVVCLILILLLKWSLIMLVLKNQQFEILVLTPMLGRLAILVSMLSSDYIRKTGLAVQIISNLPPTKVKITLLLGMILTIYYLGMVAIIIMLVTVFFINRQAKKRFGGITGDVYGATVELVEVNVLLSQLS